MSIINLSLLHQRNGKKEQHYIHHFFIYAPHTHTHTRTYIYLEFFFFFLQKQTKKREKDYSRYIYTRIHIYTCKRLIMFPFLLFIPLFPLFFYLLTKYVCSNFFSCLFFSFFFPHLLMYIKQ